MPRKILIVAFFAGLVWSASRATLLNAQTGPDWAQWGRTPQHTSSTTAVGQSPDAQLASVTFDPINSQRGWPVKFERGNPSVKEINFHDKGYSVV